MNDFKRLSFCLSAALIVCWSSSANADGPLIVDPNTRTGYHFGPEPIPVYYDLGNLGVVTDYSTRHCTTGGVRQRGRRTPGPQRLP